MELKIDIFTVVSYIISLVSCKETYLYEKQNFFGLGKRLIPNPRQVVININSGEHPQPLPTVPASPIMISSSRSLYQGIRNKSDKRVFRRKFDHEAVDKGHQVLCEGMFDCFITFLAIESSEGIPVLLRGGVGYRHFSAIVKAKPGRELRGQIRAYCKQEDGDESKTGLRSKKSFKFEKEEINSDLD